MPRSASRKKETAWEIEWEQIRHREAEAYLRQSYRVLRSPPGMGWRKTNGPSMTGRCVEIEPMLKASGGYDED